MKGMSLFSDLFMVFALIAVSLLFTAFLWAVVTVYTIAGPNAREITIYAFDYPIKNDGSLLALLEFTSNGIPMKELITQAAIQQSSSITYKGNDYDIKTISEGYLDEMFPGKKYLFVLRDPEIKLGETDTLSDTLSIVSTDIFLPNNKKVELELLVGV